MTEFEHLVNPEIHKEVFHREEAEAVLAILNRLLSGFEQKLKTHFVSGTIILDGQPLGEEASCIFRSNVGEGPFLTLPSLDQNSDQYAEKVIDEFLTWPDNPCSAYRDQLQRAAMPPASGVYSHKRMRVLVLNTMTGRFLFAVILYASSKVEVKKIELALMRACTNTMGELFPEDVILNDYVKSSRQNTHSSSKFNRYAARVVQRSFQERTLPALRRWSEWYQHQSPTTELLPLVR